MAEAATSEACPAEVVEGPPVLEEDAERQCLRQVEFYFADSNLPYDRFMWELHSKAGADRWIPIATIANFKRMRGFTVKYGMPWVVAALRQSKTLLDIDDKGENVRRKTEVKEPKGQWDRTAYVNGFGLEVSQTALENFFLHIAPVNAVRMRRHDATKAFKGSVFVEFAESSDLEMFLALDPKPKWNDNKLTTLTKEAYCLGKIKEKGVPASAITTMRKPNSHSRKGFNAFRDSKGYVKSPLPEVYIKYMGNMLRVWRMGEGAATISADSWEYVKKEDVPHVQGAAVVLTGVTKKMCFLYDKAWLARLGFDPLPYVEHQKRDLRAVFMFFSPLSDERLAALREQVPQINGLDVEWTRLAGDEEHAMQQARANQIGRSVLPRRQASRAGSHRKQCRSGDDKTTAAGGLLLPAVFHDASAAVPAEDGARANAHSGTYGKRKLAKVEPDGDEAQALKKVKVEDGVS